MLRFSIMLTLMVCLSANPLSAQTRLEKVLDDRDEVLKEGFWLYNDLEEGFEQAERTGKPLLVVLRCIPCEHCVKLDEDVMEQDPELKPLLFKFVRVRIVGTNGLDLSLFQYDYDQSFAVFMMNSDKTIYGRYGTRSGRTEWQDDVSIEGLAAALKGALQLHENYPANKDQLAGKTGPKPKYASPEQYPSLADKFTSELDYQGNVVKSCIHCHQIGDAQRLVYREAGKPMPDEVLFQYPHPKILGLIVDPDTTGTLRQVTPGSPAASAGFRPGDDIVSLEGQPILSIADMQWVLHHADDPDTLTVDVRRDGRTMTLQLPLKQGWRREGDIEWRVSSWPLRRMGTGGMKLDPLPHEERPRSLRNEDRMALLVKHVGQYGPHAAAKKAGFRQGDILTSFDGRTDLVDESKLLVYAAQNTKPGQRVTVKFLRNGQEMELKLPMQE